MSCPKVEHSVSLALNVEESLVKNKMDTCTGELHCSF